MPGDAGEPPLPAASQAGLELGKLERLAEPVMAALADRDAFLMASPADRVAQLRIVELNVPDAFKALLAEASGHLLRSAAGGCRSRLAHRAAAAART